MRLSWAIADGFALDPTFDLQQLKEIASFWGSWKTWRSCGTDNVICHNENKARELIHRNFHQSCNFYIPNQIYADLDRPVGVKLYEGKFNQDHDRADELVALHLSASQSDIVLLLGFDWTQKPKTADRLFEHNAQHYRNLVKQALVAYAQTQWVLVDGPNEKLFEEIKDLPNITQDTLNNVIKMLKG